MKYYVWHTAKRPYKLILLLNPDSIYDADWKELSNAELIVSVKRDKTDVYRLDKGKVKEVKVI